MRFYDCRLSGLTKILYGTESDAKRRKLAKERRRLKTARGLSKAAEKRRRRAHARSTWSR